MVVKKKLLNIIKTIDNKDEIKEKEKNKYKNLSEEEKEAKKQYSKNRYKKMKENDSKL